VHDPPAVEPIIALQGVAASEGTSWKPPTFASMVQAWPGRMTVWLDLARNWASRGGLCLAELRCREHPTMSLLVAGGVRPGQARHPALGDPGNLCVTGVPQRLSFRQQDLVCLTPGHFDCPRYVRAMPMAGSTPGDMPELRVRAARPEVSSGTSALTSATQASWAISPAIIFATLVLLGSAAAALAFAVAGGGLLLPVASPGEGKLVGLGR